MPLGEEHAVQALLGALVGEPLAPGVVGAPGVGPAVVVREAPHEHRAVQQHLARRVERVGAAPRDRAVARGVVVRPVREARAFEVLQPGAPAAAEAQHLLDALEKALVREREEIREAADVVGERGGVAAQEEGLAFHLELVLDKKKGKGGGEESREEFKREGRRRRESRRVRWAC